MASTPLKELRSSSLRRRFRSNGPATTLSPLSLSLSLTHTNVNTQREKKRKWSFNFFFFWERNSFKERERERSQIRNLHTNKRPSKNSDMKFVNIRSLFILCFFITPLSLSLSSIYNIKRKSKTEKILCFSGYHKQMGISRFPTPSLLFATHIKCYLYII